MANDGEQTNKESLEEDEHEQQEGDAETADRDESNDDRDDVNDENTHQTQTDQESDAEDSEPETAEASGDEQENLDNDEAGAKSGDDASDDSEDHEQKDNESEAPEQNKEASEDAEDASDDDAELQASTGESDSSRQTDGSVEDSGNYKPPYRRPGGGGPNEPNDAPDLPDDGPLLGILAFFDHPERTMEAARATRDSEYDEFDVYTPFPVHGMDEAMGLGRSWIPWVTFVAGLIGFICANAMQFGMMTFDWPMIIGGKPFAPWPSFVPIMFELTVLIGGVTTGVVMLKAAGCFQEPMILDRDLTDDRFAVWITATDPNFDEDEVREFLREQDPTEIRGITNEES